MNDKDEQLALAITEYLSDCIKSKKVHEDGAEGLEVAIQAIHEAFGIDSGNSDQIKKLSIAPTTLSSIFEIYMKTKSQMKKPELEGDADEFKKEGNKEMSAKNYQKAIDCYSKAIEIDGSNPIYYGNRSAAFASLGKPNESLEDAQKALDIDPSYTKAYSRLGHAYFSLGKYDESAQAYQKALEADPNNANLRASLSTAQDKLTAISTSSQGGERNASPFGMPPGMPPGMPAGMPDLGGMDLGGMMNNPAFMDMAAKMMNNPAISSMMQNPQFASMAQNLMRDPSALQNLMNDPQMAKMAGDMMKK